MDKAEFESLLEKARQRLQRQGEELHTAQAVRLADAQLEAVYQHVDERLNGALVALSKQRELAIRPVLQALTVISILLTGILVKVW